MLLRKGDQGVVVLLFPIFRAHAGRQVSMWGVRVGYPLAQHSDQHRVAAAYAMSVNPVALGPRVPLDSNSRRAILELLEPIFVRSGWGRSAAQRAAPGVRHRVTLVMSFVGCLRTMHSRAQLPTFVITLWYEDRSGFAPSGCGARTGGKKREHHLMIHLRCSCCGSVL